MHPHRPRLIAAGAFLVALAMAGAAAPALALTPRTAEAAAPGDPVTDLGEQVQKSQVLASLTTTAPDGTPIGVYVVSGNPNVTAEVSVIDLRSGQPLLQTRIDEGASSQRAIAQSPVDGAVYIGTSDVGHLYRYRPGADAVEHLTALPSGELAWGMDVGQDGTVWVGAYPSGKLYSFDPVTNALADHGQALPGEQYVDSIAAVGDTVYIGTQPNGRLAAFDRVSGAYTEIAMPDGHHETAISALDVRRDLMFVSTGTTIHVRDLARGEWVDAITGADNRVSPVDPHDPDLVYARINGQIHSYDLVTGAITPINARPNATPESWAWLPITSADPLLVMTYWNGGRTYGFSVTGGKGYYLSPPLLGAAAPLISLGHDDRGGVYSGAFLSPPGMGRYDSTTGQTTLLAGTSQVEGYGTFNGKVVFGRYPQGSLYVYDPSRSWAYGTNPAAPLELGEGQSRPQGFVQLDEDTVVVASVPKPGEHGGALTLWRPEDATFTVHRGVVPDQTPSSIALHDGIVYGGTSIHGGYGIDPVAAEPVLFAWDPATATTRWSIPVPDATYVAGVAVAEDGMIWATVDGRRIIEVDPETRTVTRTIPIDDEAAIDRFGDNDRILFDHGRLFASLANRLLVLDPVTEETTVLLGTGSGRDDGVDEVLELTQDTAGDLYVIAEHTRLVSYDLPDDVVAPEPAVVAGEQSPDGAVVLVSAADAVDPDPVVQFRIDGGEWRTSASPARVVVPYGATLEYRAKDSAWNASATGAYAAPASAQHPPTISVDRSQARRGSVVEVTGAGFTPGDTVSLQLRRGDLAPGEATVSEDGSLRASVRVPEDVRPGRADVVAVTPAGSSPAVKLVVVP
ncbi:NHL repeat-containing protein [Microbacterium resistens]|uniref:PQQ-binding-like beta-propeller repeat protein n=1 Tax=Microbacterium resistens TaxID=156977 RepID=UPI00083667F0|nr:PQQ-binding-like beta-propeller repeat protein [Microbacterium resistens]